MRVPKLSVAVRATVFSTGLLMIGISGALQSAPGPQHETERTATMEVRLVALQGAEAKSGACTRRG